MFSSYHKERSWHIIVSKRGTRSGAASALLTQTTPRYWQRMESRHVRYIYNQKWLFCVFYNVGCGYFITGVSHLSHLSLPSPCAGKRVLQRPFHRTLSLAHSSLMFQAVKSLLTVSVQLNFVLPLGRFPHLHFNNYSDVFCFISSVDVPEPFQPSPSHNHRYGFHICFSQDLLISPVF